MPCDTVRTPYASTFSQSVGRFGRTAAFILAAGFVAFAAAAEGLSPGDIFRLREVSSVAISPDGSQIAYTLRVSRIPGHGEDGPSYSELYVTDLEGDSRRFVTGKVNVSRIEWTPGGRGIAFVAKLGDDEHASLYFIPIDGGQARRIVSYESDIRDYSFSPDGERVAFLATPPESDERSKLRDKGFKQKVYEEEFRNARVFVAAPDYDGDGHTNGGPVSDRSETNGGPVSDRSETNGGPVSDRSETDGGPVSDRSETNGGPVSDRSGPAAPRALDLPGSAVSVAWSPAGDRLAVKLAPTPRIDDVMMKSQVHIVDLDGSVIGKVETVGKLGDFAWSPDGRRLALITAADIHDPREGRLSVADAGGGPARDILPDLAAHVVSIAWRDNDFVMYLTHEGVWSTFERVRHDGSEQRTIVEPGGPVLRGLHLARNELAGAFVGSSPEHPAEVFTMKHGEAAPRRVTDSNPWLAHKRLARQELIRHNARDGLELEGILVYPLDYQTGTKYPLVMIVHGGPEAHVSNEWLTTYSRPGQVFAARGIAVFYPNYRGSTGRGVEFSKLGQADYAGREFDDLVDAVNHLDRMGLVAPGKVAVTGGSYGGYASAWCATKLSEHFAAAVMAVGISDKISAWGTTDIPNEKYLVHARSWPWERWEFYHDRSPIYHADKGRTPLLILHGEEDTRVHPSQSLSLYRYMKLHGRTPVRLVLYPGEGHGNSRAAARYDYCLRLLRWMEHYLTGPGGDPPPPEIDYELDALVGASSRPAVED